MGGADPKGKREARTPPGRVEWVGLVTCLGQLTNRVAGARSRSTATGDLSLRDRGRPVAPGRSSRPGAVSTENRRLRPWDFTSLAAELGWCSGEGPTRVQPCHPFRRLPAFSAGIFSCWRGKRCPARSVNSGPVVLPRGPYRPSLLLRDSACRPAEFRG